MLGLPIALIAGESRKTEGMSCDDGVEEMPLPIHIGEFGPKNQLLNMP